MIELLLELDFKLNKEGYYARNFYSNKDRFGYNIFIDTELNEILFVKKGMNDNYWQTIKDIESNVNELNGGILKFYNTHLKGFNLKDWSK